MQHDDLAEIDVTEREFDAMLAESEPVALIGPPGPAQRVRFEVIGDRLRTYGWRLVAADGEVLAVSATTYSSKAGARRALAALAAALQSAPVAESVDDDDQEPRTIPARLRWLRQRSRRRKRS